MVVAPVGTVYAVPEVNMTADGEKEASDVAVTVAELLTYPVLVVVIVAVELVLPDTPVTVTSPLPLIATEPDAVAVPAHVYKAE